MEKNLSLRVLSLTLLLMAATLAFGGGAGANAQDQPLAQVRIVANLGGESAPSPDPLTREERDWVRSHGPIIYAPDPSFPPFEYFDRAGGAGGITPDLLSRMGERLGVRISVARYETWSEVLRSVKAGEADILGTLTRTPERETFLDFTGPYLSVPYVIFVRQETRDIASVEDLEKRKWGVVKGYGINTWLAANHPNVHPVEVTTTAEGLARVSSGELDAMLETLPVGQYVIREHSLSNLSIAPAEIYSLPQHLGVRKGHGPLLSIMEKGLKSLTEAEKIDTYIRWTGQDFTRPPLRAAPVWRNAVLTLLGLLLLGLVWIWTLRRAVDRAVSAQMASEDRFRRLVELAPDTILQGDPAGNIIGANRSAEALTGYSVEELLKLNISALFTEGERQRVPLRYDLLKEGRTVRSERMLIRKDGALVPIDMNTNMMPDGSYQTFIRDVSVQRHAEEILRASEQKFSIAFHAAPLLMSISEIETGRYIDVNEQFCRVSGFPREEAIGKTSIELGWIGVETRKKLVEKLKERGGVKDLELTLTAKGGHNIHCLYSAEIITIGGRPLLLSIALDVTEKKRLREELDKTQRLEALGVLAGGIAHDFNNLLTGILGNISLARSTGEMSPAAAKFLEDSEKASVRAAALVQQLLTFARGGAPLKKIVRLAPVINEAATFVLRGSVSKATIRVAPDLKNVEADEGQINQALNNLLINAVQAMPGGGIVTVTAQNEELAADNPHRLPPGTYAAISIKDQGTGIPPENLIKIFDPYFTTKTTGTGLGLATVYSIITRHNGAVTAENPPEGGALFSILLPAAERSAEEHGSPLDAYRKGEGRILIMDDEETIREVLKTMLRTLGYTPVAVSDGREAIMAVEQGKLTGEPYAAAILDLTVPGGMGGKEAARRLRELAPLTRLIASSGYSDDASIARYADHGFDGAIPKPYKLATLSAELARVTGGGEGKG